MSSPNSASNMGTPSSPTDRRGSQGVAFAGLMNQKRNSVDAAAAARRASFHDTKPKAGFLGTMWNNWTQGPSGAAK